MRGKAQAEQVRRFLNGITPAYAGKRTKSSRCPPRMWDHPRVCGEKNLCILRRVEIPGSPPRMRGKAPTKTGCSCPGGITPAYAGKRREDCDMGMYDRDHPRVCGEKQKWALLCRFGRGSPPRMRGKALSTPKKNTVSRITPAYAGKSKRSGALSRGQKDHPRVCGEKKIRRSRFAAPLGSPPRMRGKADELPPHVGGYGITPAYAGKSLREAGMIC